MNILRTILRVGLIAILVCLLVFLSVKIFKLIPKAINNLASATVSIGGLTDEKPASSTTPTVVVVQPAPTTADGLNGVVIQPNPTTTTYATPTPTRINTGSSAPTPTHTAPAPQYSYATYPSYNPYANQPASEYSPAGGKNIKLTYTSIGIIDPVTNQYIPTNSFKTTDTISLRFKILNEEDSPTGAWNMRVTMPAAAVTDRVKILNNLSSIPGESSYTAEARFTGVDLSQGTPTIHVVADPENRIAERNESDNTLTVQMLNVQTPYTYTNPGYIYNNGYTYTDPYNNNYTNGNQQCYTDAYGQYMCYNSGYNNGYNNGNGYYSGSSDQCYSRVYGYYNCGTTNNNNSYYTSPNLTISSIETGRMINGSFYQTTTIPYNEAVTIRVRVRNDGGNFGSQWMARLAVTNQASGYRELNSSYQSPLQAGGEQTIYFEAANLIQGNQTFTVTIDAQNSVSEVNENDNTKSVTIYIN
jgi:CARDB